MSTMGSISVEEKNRLKAIIADTVTLLCKNGLNAKFKREFTVEGLIGITLDKGDLLLVSIRDTIENPNPPPASDTSGESGESSGGEMTLEGGGGSGRKRKRKRKKRTAGGGEKKTDDSDNDDYNDDSSPAKRSLFSNQNPGQTDNSNLESNDSFFTLHDIKQDHSDDDLIEIIKEEPGLRSPGSQYHGQHGQPPHIVSIQTIPGQSPQNTGQYGQMSPHPSMAGMSPGGSMAGGMPPGPAGLQMAPGQYEDLMQQVELIPGSGVFIKKATYNQLQFIDKGSKLVRKLVREIFPDVHLLASSSCMGKGETSAGLDRHKVEVIKEFACRQTGIPGAMAVQAINFVCTNTRNYLKKKGIFTKPHTNM